MDSPTDAPIEELPHNRQDAVRHDGRTTLPHFIQQRNHIAFSYLVDCPGAPNREHLTMQNAGCFARGSVLGDVAVDELSHEVCHLIGVDAALRFPLLCLGITAGSPLRKNTLSFNPGLVGRHRPIFTYRVLARLAAIPSGSVLDEECPPVSRRDFQAEAFEVVIPPYGVTVSGAGGGRRSRACLACRLAFRGGTHAGYLDAK
jgi:hypothetical protein